MLGDNATYCNTEAFAARVNADSFCGASDWRLPNVHELVSISVYGKDTSPAMDVDFFPNHTPQADIGQGYLTTTLWVVKNQDVSSFLQAGNGGVSKGLRSSTQLVRLVRTAP